MSGLLDDLLNGMKKLSIIDIGLDGSDNEQESDYEQSPNPPGPHPDVNRQGAMTSPVRSGSSSDLSTSSYVSQDTLHSVDLHIGLGGADFVKLNTNLKSVLPGHSIDAQPMRVSADSIEAVKSNDVTTEEIDDFRHVLKLNVKNLKDFCKGLLVRESESGFIEFGQQDENGLEALLEHRDLTCILLSRIDAKEGVQVDEGRRLDLNESLEKLEASIHSMQHLLLREILSKQQMFEPILQTLRAELSAQAESLGARLFQSNLATTADSQQEISRNFDQSEFEKEHAILKNHRKLWALMQGNPDEVHDLKKRFTKSYRDRFPNLPAPSPEKIVNIADDQLNEAEYLAIKSVELREQAQDQNAYDFVQEEGN